MSTDCQEVVTQIRDCLFFERGAVVQTAELEKPGLRREQVKPCPCCGPVPDRTPPGTAGLLCLCAARAPARCKERPSSASGRMSGNPSNTGALSLASGSLGSSHPADPVVFNSLLAGPVSRCAVSTWPDVRCRMGDIICPDSASSLRRKSLSAIYKLGGTSFPDFGI